MKKAIKPVALILASILLRCANSSIPMAGGASSTEVGVCTLKGSVLDSLNLPIAGGIVRLRPFDYIPLNRVKSDKTTFDAATDKYGAYSFDSVKTGRYCIECVFHDSFGQTIDYTVDSGETLAVLPSVKLIPMAIIAGQNLPPETTGSDKATVQTLGMEHTATIDVSGNFTMMVPAGWTRLSFQGVDSGTKIYDTISLIYGKPGDTVEIAPSRAHVVLNPCSDLKCDLAAVREILDTAGLLSVMPESVVVISDNRVSELHLRGKMIKRLSGSFGGLTNLKVLDIGKNYLDSLPSSAFEHLYFLEKLIADNNSLRMLPASVGMLKALQSLDLSYNQLQSIPEPITYLYPSALLNLNGNMLCDIGAVTAKWADRYNPDWMKTQRCTSSTPTANPSDSCVDLKCDLAIVREILDSAGLNSVTPESVVVVSQNTGSEIRVSELHLRSMGIKRLNGSLGKLTFLKVLDVGRNCLESLPSSTFESLFNLETLIADSNLLQSLPVSGGMLKSIQKLDLSNNRLQSLPEQMIYFRPIFLSLDNNMLCNIGDATAKWADQYDPKWRWTQQCN